MLTMERTMTSYNKRLSCRTGIAYVTLKFWKINGNILEMLQDRKIVAMED